MAGGGENEYYTYQPNPDRPEETENVQLKGNWPFRTNAYTGIASDDFVMTAFRGELGKVRDALNGGMDINVRNNKGRTALMSACEGGHIELVKILLSSGAEVNAQDKEYDTALACALMARVDDRTSRDGKRWGHSGIVRILLDNGADVNLRKKGSTLSIAVSHQNNSDIVRMLINAGADIEARTATGRTALGSAISGGDPESIKIVLGAGADVNAADEYGDTPLMQAASGNAELVQMLLQKGANVNARNARGHTALTIAKWLRGNEAVVGMLVKAGAGE